MDADVIVHHRGRSLRAAAILLPPQQAHALEAPGTGVGLFWALGSPGVPWTSCAAGPVLVEGKTCDALRAWAKHVARAQGGQDPGSGHEALRMLRLPFARRIDARVEGTLRRLAANPQASLLELAGRVRLSPERLRHLIALETGVPFREHRLLQKTTVALEHALAGASLTSAAVAAGFSDQAHLTRTFVRFFGRTPSSRPSQAWLHESWAPRQPESSLAVNA
jgi:AraC-like DNA-binding protein